MTASIEHAKSLIRDVADFPQKGIIFKDITPLLQDAGGLAAVVQGLADPFRDRGIEAVIGIESRGFILGAPVALALNCGFVPVRKPGKLPAATVKKEYALEYGTDAVEIHRDALRPGQRVLLVDDVLATGGTMQATASLIEGLGAEIEALVFLLELGFLEGRKKLSDKKIHSLIEY